MKYRLGELAEITRGISYKGSDYSTKDDINAESFINLKCISADGFRWDGIKYYKGVHKLNQSVYEGDLLIANTDLTRNREVIGNSILVPKLDREGACFSHHLTKIKIYDETIIDRKYLYYLLKAPKIRSYMIGNSDGTTVVMLPAKAISKLEIDLPDLETQKKIVRILSALDSKIELNNARCERLRQISACIFLNFTKNIKNSKKITIGELCNIKYGKNLPSKNLLKSGYPVYGANGIIGYYNEKTYNTPQVLVSCRGVAGAVHISEPECFVTNNSLVLECDKKYHHFIKEYSLSRRYDDYATGSAQPQITINNIKDHELYIPMHDAELDALNRQCEPIERQIFTIIAQNKKLNELRGTLLPKLMNGEINLIDIKSYGNNNGRQVIFE